MRANCESRMRNGGTYALGLPGRDADIFLKRIEKKLARKWKQPYSRTIDFISIHFAISMVHAKSRFIRGSRSMTNAMYRHIDWEDGAGLSLYSTLKQFRPCSIKIIMHLSVTFFDRFLLFIKTSYSCIFISMKKLKIILPHPPALSNSEGSRSSLTFARFTNTT